VGSGGVTLNPALAKARFCPRCAAPAEVHYPRSLVCPQCGFTVDELPWDELVFWSTELALRDALPGC
jgi:predicted amidophosphoribosyltransferase